MSFGADAEPAARQARAPENVDAALEGSSEAQHTRDRPIWEAAESSQTVQKARSRICAWHPFGRV